MKFTLSWLKSHLQTDKDAEAIIEKLSLIGLEVEDSINKHEVYKDFIIAEILSAEPHPNANKLQVCKVFDGDKELQIVCGAENARAGIKVVLAPIGAIVPAGEFKIKRSKIRDIESEGMLCSEDELLLGENSEGIMELPADSIVGSKFADYAGLNDTVIEIGLTPNRGDCANVRGIARDLAAAGMGTLKKQQATDFQHNGKDAGFNINIENNDACSEFTLTRIDNVKNAGSSKFSSFLKAIGMSGKSTLVDLSNFCMLDLGRPNHVYDADKVNGSISIRYSKDGEEFVPISGEKINLPAELLVVADEREVLAIAGVIGGENSKVTESTKNILVEVANFDPIEVMKAGRKLNIHTDSRFRFERRVDYANTRDFLNTFVNNILNECGGEAFKTTEGTCKIKEKDQISFDFNYIKTLTGVDVAQKEAAEILEKLDFVIQGNNITVPSFRQGDVISKADIVEEIMRIKGYENVHAAPIAKSTKEKVELRQSFSDGARVMLAQRGMKEVYTWSFISGDLNDLFGFKMEDCVEVVNPISEQMSVMRKSIIPSLLTIIKENHDFGRKDLSLFEIASIYDAKNPHALNKNITGVREGKKSRKSVFKNERDIDFYDVKADFFSLIETYGLDPQKLQIKLSAPSYYHPGKSCAFYLGKSLIGYVGEINPIILKHFDIEESCVAFELFTDNLPKLKYKTAKNPIQSFKLQPVYRDFSFLVNDGISAAEIKSIVMGTDKKLISGVEIFDIYKGKNITEGMKSVAISVAIQPLESSLSDKDIEAISNNVTGALKENLSASFRL